MTDARNRSLVSIKVGDTVVPWISRGGCKVCGSSCRLQCERLIAQGRTYSAIVKLLPDDANISAENLSDHFRNHMSDAISAAAVKRVANEETKEVAEVIEPAVAATAAALRLHRAVTAAVARRVDNGEAIPTVKDGLDSERFCFEIDREAARALGESEWMDMMLHVLDCAERHMTPEQWQQLGANLRASPVYQRAFASRAVEAR